MANELRVRVNSVGGLIEDNPLPASGGGSTTLNSAALAALPVIGSTQHLAIVLDPDGLYGAPEIAWITAHTAGATSATLLRAQEATTAREHVQDVPWSHAPTLRDFDGEVAWHVVGASGEPVFVNSWTHYDTSNYYGAAFRRDAAGFVHLRGLVKDGTGGTSIFTLPIGYRPTRSCIFEAYVNVGSGARVDVSAVGVVQLSVPASGAIAYLSLESITFQAEQ